MQGIDTILNVLGSVCLLLWGVRMVRTGLTRAFGATLRRAIGACSRNRFSAFAGGMLLTGILQSSTATALLLASFAGRGLISLSIGLAVMLGANVGTTLTAQILSFPLGWISPLMIAAGVIAFLSNSSDRARHLGRVAIGLGLMLLSLHLLEAAALPLRNAPAFVAVLAGLQDEYVMAVLVAAAATWFIHSSLSTVLLVMSFATSGIIDPKLGMAMVIGANIGGAIAPYFDQAATDKEARRLPLGNLITRVLVGLALLPFLGQLHHWLMMLDPAPGRLLVNFHTAFSVVAAIVFLPLIDPVAALCRRLVPDRPQADDPGKPRNLDPNVLDTPAEALACAMRETLNLGDKVADMLRQTMDVFERNDARAMKSIEAADDAVDSLYEAIKLYLIQTSRTELGEEDGRRYVEILTFVTNLEHAGDIIDKNLMELAAKKIRNRYAFSAEGTAELRAFHARVLDNLRLALNVFTTRDITLARRLVAEKTAMREAEARAADSHYARLREGRPESIETSSIHMDVVRDLKRINGHLATVAYPILEAAGELAETRLKTTDQPLIRNPLGS
ncbi:Na/Pi cotransporter family protein [Reyranella sp. MMS21-HV4-11]|uniref:Na/Pi cotransporter family protein n=1 Tax=Reyranella humidisoli TaxID=2849149 RepID=A0ABS6ILN3_9HYPH|nr:Na/Pi cotransporter family protein [Reyranella sp. MMS21-HV4-11]MBU8875218.1 Na/Pi cotransporter family protein [Reyranella sp. MMS21-HV4-11]